jgi:DNA-directed RNA polymerase specialized sigma24 family protein
VPDTSFEGGTLSATRRDRFERLYRDHHPAVRAYLLRRAEPELAQDALSETFLAAWRRLDELPKDRLPWLLATARRTLANQRRSAKRLGGLRERMATRETTEAADPAEQVSDADLMRRALSTLSEADREVLMLVARRASTAPAPLRLRAVRERRSRSGRTARESDSTAPCSRSSSPWTLAPTTPWRSDERAHGPARPSQPHADRRAFDG